MRTPEIYRHFFKTALEEQRARVAEYEAEVKDWYENGDGRPREMAWEECPVCNGTGGRSVHYGGGENLTTSFERCGHCQEGQQYVNVGGQGHTFPVCIHGRSLWVDYDIPCGACEMGESDLEIARGRARFAWLQFCDMWEWANKAPAALPYDLKQQLLHLTIAMFPKAKEATR